jgi:hypothetical protein
VGGRQQVPVGERIGAAREGGEPRQFQALPGQALVLEKLEE